MSEKRDMAARKEGIAYLLIRRRGLFWMAVCATFIGAFLLTFLLTAPEAAPTTKREIDDSKADLFATFFVSDKQTLAAAARASHLETAKSVRGLLEDIARSYNGRVKIGGWVVDPRGRGEIANVIVFANGESILQLRTRGARYDVAKSLNLSDLAVINAAFQGELQCKAGQHLIVAAVTRTGLYNILDGPDPLICPG